jgi:hypothetical protein
MPNKMSLVSIAPVSVGRGLVLPRVRTLLRLQGCASASRRLGLRTGDPIFRLMCGRAHLSSDVSEIKLVFSIPPHRPTPNISASWNVAPTDPLPVVRYDPRPENVAST